MSRIICETCGSAEKDLDLLPFSIIPEEVAECPENTVLNTVVLCANCRKDISDQYHDKVHKVNYEKESQQFIPLSAEELAQKYESVYNSFYAHKRFIRMKETYSDIKKSTRFAT